MINIGSTDFFIGVPSLPRGEFEEYSTSLFDDWEKYVEGILHLTDYSLSLNVEEGSIKAIGKIAATTLGVLYIGIGQYGSFISGVQTIDNQVRAAGDYLGKRASAPFEASNIQAQVRKRGASLTKLKGLFTKVQKGQLSVEEAMHESELIFGSEIDTVPGFVNDLRQSLEQTPRDLEQIQLPLVNSAGEVLLPTTEKREPKKERQSPKREPAPAPDQYRVEVWRESRRGKRNVRITSL